MLTATWKGFVSERDDGKVRDLVERLQKREINHKEAYKLLIETGLTEDSASIGVLVFWIAGLIAFLGGFYGCFPLF